MPRAIRVLVVDTCYPAFLAAHYSERPGLDRRPYDEQLASLIARSFGTSDAYSVGLGEAGVEASEVIANCWPLQRRWLAEHTRRSPWALLPASPAGRAVRLLAPALEAVLRAQVREYDPDVVYMQNMSFPSARLMRSLRDEGRFAAGQIASPAPPDDHLRRFDLIVTSFPHFVERFRSLGVDSEYLPLAFDVRALERYGATERTEPVVFVGGIDPNVHTAGTALLERVAEDVGLAVWGYGAEALAGGSPLRKAWRGEAWGADMYSVLGRAQIVLNRHIDAAEGFANNMRLFEATGMGALLFTESAPNLADLFEPDRELVTYDGAGDLVEKLRHYLGADDERRAIARAGQQRTLVDHNYTRRMAQLADLLRRRTG